MEMDEVKAPAAVLATAVLAYEPVEPALQPAGQVEIRPVDGEDERFLQHAGVKPVRQDQFESARVSVHVRCLLPFIDPGEAVPSTFRRLSNRRHDSR